MDWIQDRIDRSSEGMRKSFYKLWEELKTRIEQDIFDFNAKACSGRSYKCSLSNQRTTLHVTAVPSDVRDAAVIIQFGTDVNGSSVIAEDTIKQARIVFTPALNASGTCKMAAGSKVCEVWQVSKMILEHILFQEEVSDSDKPTATTGNGYRLG